MPQETKTITLELTERQSTIIFGLISNAVEQVACSSIGEIIETANRNFRISQHMLEEINEDPAIADCLDVLPRILELARQIHEPFCEFEHDEDHHGS